MALSLKDKETDRLAREVAALTGETLTDAICNALAEGWSASDCGGACRCG
jgi:antitoxin VapB